MEEDRARLLAAIEKSPLLAPLLRRWDEIALPDCRIVAGALAQTVWNDRFGYAPDHGIVDIDIVYFDQDDLSERGEAHEAARIRALFPEIPAWLDVKNEARVHLWYAGRFGFEIAPYASMADAISTFPTTATSIGIRPGAGGIAIEAPFGLSDLMSATVRPNKTQVSRDVYEAKVGRWQALWPELTVMRWDD